MVFLPSPKIQHSKAFNVNVIIRILSILHENGRFNRTNLAGRSGLNYNKCVSYVKLLQSLEWIKIISDDGLFVVITEKGTEIIEKLTNFDNL
jgi:predicted transcriptional regulator